MAALLDALGNVKFHLMNDPDTRGDDEMLAVLVYKEYDPLLSELYAEFVERRQELGAPTLETIRRSRQKLQEGFEDLRPDIYTLKRRRASEKEYKDFFGGNNHE